MKHELVQLAAKIEWAWIDGEIVPLYSDKGRPGMRAQSLLRTCCTSWSRSHSSASKDVFRLGTARQVSPLPDLPL